MSDFIEFLIGFTVAFWADRRLRLWLGMLAAQRLWDEAQRDRARREAQQ